MSDPPNAPGQPSGAIPYTPSPELIEALVPPDLPAEIRQARDAAATLLEAAWAQQAGSPGDLRAIPPGMANLQGVGIGVADSQRPPGPDNYALTVMVESPIGDEDVRALLAPVLGPETAALLPLRVIHDGTMEALVRGFKMRPAPGGLSTSHEHLGSGTIGCLARGREGSRKNATMLLSCAHVYAPSSYTHASPGAFAGDPVIQPGASDTQDRSRIGTLDAYTRFQWVTPKQVPKNSADAAVARCDSVQDVDRRIYYDPDGQVIYRTLGTPIAAYNTMHVVKSGRTTGVTRGVVESILATRRVRYGSNVAAFYPVFLISPDSGTFVQPGDSGSLVWQDVYETHPVGLIFSGDPQTGYGYANPISLVTDSLRINLITN